MPNPIAPGTAAPAIPGIDFAASPTALFFYKVTCPVCQMAAPIARSIAEAYPGRVTAVGQDPPDKLASFDRQYGLGIEPRPDLPPYPVSNAYGIRVVPTLFLIDTAGTISDVVESWDRDGYRRLSKGLADLLGTEPAKLGIPTTLPSFRPG
jgi:thiol-disulfide isomerase/thioredoxin